MDELKQTPETTQKKRRGKVRKNRKAAMTAAIAGGVAVAALCITHLSVSAYYRNHFYPGSSVNGIDSSGATVEEFTKTLNEQAVDYELTVASEIGDEVIEPEDVGLSVTVSEDVIKKELEKQSGFGWIPALSHHTKYKVERMVSYDESKLDEVIAELACVRNPRVVKSENATYEYAGGEFRIKDEIYGNEVKVDTLKKAIDKALLTLDEKIDLKDDDCYVLPEITKDNEELQSLVKTMNDKTGMTITYTLGSQTEKITKDLIVDWLTIDEEKGEVSYDREKIAAFVSDMASKYNTFGRAKTLKTSYGSTVTVPGGSYGWRINQEGEVDQIIADLSAGNDVSRDFIYSQTAASHDGNDYGNTYVEVNITGQHMYCYVNGARVLDSPTVTGDVSKNRITHVGAYFIQYCERNATLRGEGYETKVAYWMPFHIGEGLHDATWNPRFGGQYYKTHGSHGCVNLPYAAAQSLFGYAYAGMPVLVYELPGTEDTSYEQSKAASVVNMIDAIGEVTADSEDKIVAARNAYKNLGAEIRPYVTNLSKLEAAEAALSAAKNAKEQEGAAAKSAAQSVINQIAAIGDVTELSGPPIQQARSAYNALSEEAKALVTNYNVLQAAEVAFAAIGTP